jgi:hypothetical protein
VTRLGFNSDPRARRRRNKSFVVLAVYADLCTLPISVLTQTYAIGPQEIRFRQGQLRYAR